MQALWSGQLLSSCRELLAKGWGHVLLEQYSDVSAAPKAPLYVLHAGPGAGKSTVAVEILERLAPVFGNNIVRFLLPQALRPPISGGVLLVTTEPG